MLMERSALTLRAKKLFLEWVLSLGNDDGFDDISLDYLNQNKAVYLLLPEDLDDPQAWIETNFHVLMENEFTSWTEDPASWPNSHDLELFNDFFDVEFHDLVFDTVS